MESNQITYWRLCQQGLLDYKFNTPGEYVRWMGAVQAQDYLASLWAVGLRIPNATEATIEAAIADKSIVRTWPMRGTIHYLPGQDIRWILKLTEPRNRMFLERLFAGKMKAVEGLDITPETFTKSFAIFEKALQGDKHLTRDELAAALRKAGIATDGLQFTWILHQAQAEALICHGPRRGKQFTFTLLDEWLPPTRMLDREEALAEFTRRYFTGHGPALPEDFA